MNDEWAFDFVDDSLYRGKRFRTLAAIDVVARDCIAVEADTFLPAMRLV